MSDFHRFYYNLLKTFLSSLIKTKEISINFKKNSNINQFIVYLLPCDSKINLVALEKECKKQNLPNPFFSLKIDKISLSRYLIINRHHLIINRHPNYLNNFTEYHKLFKKFNKYIHILRDHPNLDIQILPTLIMFGRNPKKNKNSNDLYSTILNKIQKFFTVLLYGRKSYICFSKTISLRHMLEKKHNQNKLILQKIAHISHIQFSRQALAITGPHSLKYYNFLNKILNSKTIKKTIEYETRNKNISQKQVKKQATKIIKELSANFSNKIIHITDYFLGLIWNKLYKKIHVTGIECIRKLIEKGDKIIYIPCHRSHMDYLLISYVLYHKELALPYIIAGINLNFWPIGIILKRLGAFFIRRNFKGNKLYSKIFQKYLGILLRHGYSIEYFIEGRRSRTGKLLYPKTGALTVTLQASLQKKNLSISLIPINISYEKLIEINSYIKELSGIPKKKESFMQMIFAFWNLKKLGQSYINFGEPLSVTDYLNKNIPKWRNSTNINIHHPYWLIPTVKNIANHLMIRINEASTINGINLCVMALLSTDQFSLKKEHLIKQLECYTQLLHNVPYSKYIIIPKLPVEKLLEEAIQTNQFKTEKNIMGNITKINLPENQVISMTYYRNNIHHMFIIPSLIATIIQKHKKINKTKLLNKITQIYPLMKSEFFLPWNIKELPEVLMNLTKEFKRQLLIRKKNNLEFSASNNKILSLLASSVQEVLQRYIIIFSILTIKPNINRLSLEKESLLLAKKISVLHRINSIDFFDKKIFSIIITTLRKEGYLFENNRNNILKIKNMLYTLLTLTSNKIQIIIKNILKKNFPIIK